MTCPKCGGALTRYRTWRDGQRARRRTIHQCRFCFNRYRRQRYRKTHPPRPALGPGARLRLRLTDWYVRTLLSQRRAGGRSRYTPAALWPDWLVQLKRKQIQLRRLCLTTHP